HESAGRFGGQQQSQSSRIARGLHGGPLPGVFGQTGLDVVGHLANTAATGVDLEQRGGFGHTVVDRLRVPVLGGADRVGGADEFGPGEDRMGQTQVVAAVDAHSGGQQRRVPLRGVAEDPPRRGTRTPESRVPGPRGSVSGDSASRARTNSGSSASASSMRSTTDPPASRSTTATRSAPARPSTQEAGGEADAAAMLPQYCRPTELDVILVTS